MQRSRHRRNLGHHLVRYEWQRDTRPGYACRRASARILRVRPLSQETMMSKHGPLYRPKKKQTFDLPEDRNGTPLSTIVITVVAGVALIYSASIGIRKYQAHIADERLKAQEYMYQRDKEALNSILHELKDAEMLAASSPRLALGGPVATLQAIGRKTNNLKLKTDCMNQVKPILARHIEEHVTGYLYFMQDKQKSSSVHLEQSNAAFDQLIDKIDECSPA